MTRTRALPTTTFSARYGWGLVGVGAEAEADKGEIPRG